MIDIRIPQDAPDTPEYHAAEDLKGSFQKTLPTSVRGEMLIVPHVTCLGERFRDIDIVAIGHIGAPWSCPSDGTEATARVHGDKPRRVGSFCACIEVKDHPQDSIQFGRGAVWVRYGKRRHDTSYQSKQQAKSLANLLRRELGIEVTVANLIWLRRAPASMIPRWAQNCLPRAADLTYDLFESLVASQLEVVPGQAESSLSAWSSDRGDSVDTFMSALRHFENLRANVGKITRERLERIQKPLLKEQQYAREIGRKLVAFRGGPGTGKTVKMLNIAHDLCTRRGKRCLLLTYNTALASDIERTIALSGIRRADDGPTVEVSTVYRFMCRLAARLGVAEQSRPGDYSQYAPEVAAALEALRRRPSRALELVEKWPYHFDWDFVVVDEGQDWLEAERDLLYELYGSHRVVVTDGVEQLVRQSAHTDWTADVEGSQTVGLRRSVRATANLCKFQETFAKMASLSWDIQPSAAAPGGRVVVTSGKHLKGAYRAYSPELHSELAALCRESGNGPYEMPILVPPIMVDGGNGIKSADEWANWGIPVWDGTLRVERTDYPVSLGEYRVLQYDSSRGIEGCVVVCSLLDEFVRYKTDTHAQQTRDQLPLSLDEEAKRFAYQWTMVPLTRATDVLAITIWDPNCPFCRLLKEVCDECPGFTEWRD